MMARSNAQACEDFGCRSGFSVMAVLHVTRVMAGIYLTQRFIIAWRVWLTHHLTQDWLDAWAYYRRPSTKRSTIPTSIQQDVDSPPGQAALNAPLQRDGQHAAFRGRSRSFPSIFTSVESPAPWNIFGVSIPRAMF